MDLLPKGDHLYEGDKVQVSAAAAGERERKQGCRWGKRNALKGRFEQMGDHDAQRHFKMTK